MTVLSLESATRFGTEGGVIRGLESYVAEEPPGGGELTVTTPIPVWQRETGSDASVSASFTVAVDDLVVFAISSDEFAWFTGPTNSGTAFIWTQRATSPSSPPITRLYTAVATVAQSMTVSVTANSAKCYAHVWVVSGQDDAPIGVSGGAQSTSEVVDQSYTAGAAGSVVFVVASDWYETGVLTSSNLLDMQIVEVGGWCDAILGHRLNAAAGATSFNLDAAGGPLWGYCYLEIIPAPVAAEFSPADITGLACWYDPSDAATITLSGADITGVANKGGADFDLTTAGTVAQGTQYGLDTFDFGIEQLGNFEYNGGSTVIAGLECSAVQVFKRIGGSGPRGLGMFAATGDDWNTAGGAAILGNDPSYPGCYRNFGQKSYANPAATWNEWHVAMSIFDGTNHTMYLDGVAGTPVASTDTFATVRLRVGAGSYSERWVGEMGDVLLYEHALDATERADLLTYLRAKWMPVPKRINGLLGWWDASDAASFTFSSGSAVSQWQDKMGDDTRHHFAQATSGQQPQRTGTQNGLPTVVFDGTRQMTTGEWFPGISYPSIWVVTKCTETVDNIQLLHAGGIQMYKDATNMMFYAGTSVGVAIDTNWHVLGGVFNGASSSQRVDGVQVSTGNPGSTALDTWIELGHYSNGYRYEGEIAEIVVYDHALTAPEITQIESYLMDKWGL